jgi:hypothetical protein
MDHRGGCIMDTLFNAPMLRHSAGQLAAGRFPAAQARH